MNTHLQNIMHKGNNLWERKGLCKSKRRLLEARYIENRDDL